MVSPVKWEKSTSTKTVVIDLGTTLATDTLSAVGATPYDNTLAANLDTFVWFELQTSSGNLFSTAVTRANATVDIYAVRALDGTNYENAPVTADLSEFPQLKIASIPIPTETGVVPATPGRPFALDPYKHKFYVFNNTDQTMQNTWQLNIYVNNLEGQ